MRGKRWGLSTVFILLLALLLGVDEAWSQAAQFQICNHSSTKVYVVVARKIGINDDRFLLSGWYIADPGNCHLTNVYIPWGNFYVYADGQDGRHWSGNDNRFCVSQKAFERIVDPSPGCAPGLHLVSFTRYFTSDTGGVTWHLYER